SRANPDPHPLASPIGLDNTVRDCVPFNVMGFGNISREAINYIGTDKYSVGIVEQDFAETVLSGKVFDGWGYGPVSAAFGLTYRTPSFVDEAFPLDVDALGPPQNAPELGIRGIPAGYTGGSPNLHQFSTVPYIYGDYSVWEWFTEWQVPVWESASKAQRVNSQIAFRSSNYNLSGRSDTWKLGIDAQLMEGLRFRATKSLDVREASFSERFDSQGGGGAVRDRFNADVNTSITVTATGNPDLSPETANTLVAGIVLQPTWRYLDGLSVSADWYKVDISGSIQQISAQDVMDRCFAGDQEQCSHIIREADGTVAGITRMFFNQDMAKVKGVDLEMSYRMTPNFFPDQKETLNVRLLSGWLRERKDINRAGVVTNLLGGYATPTFTGNLTATYGVGPWGFQLQGRYIIGGKLNRLYVEGIQVDKNWLPSVTTWNGQINYRGEFASGATWMAGLAVQNLFDRNPPIILSTATTGAQGTISNQYDAYGRRYNVSLNVNF
ncbi:MAG: TonB-dependent receptor, partial [Pseudomonadales bacterium]|nr:TonB-dependent receptor [Pseudomonadales bacterium]